MLKLLINSSIIISAIILISSCDDNNDDNNANTTTNPEQPIEYDAGDQITFTADNVSFKMVYIPGGITFPTGVSDDSTATVADPYLIAETEVTYELWATVYNWATDSARSTNIYTFAHPGRQGGTTSGTEPTGTIQHPVTTINRRDAMVWCNALTEWYNAKNSTTLTCVYNNSGTPLRDSTEGTGATLCDAVVPDWDNTGFRLPTNNEWELAARWRNDSNIAVLSYTDPYFTPGNYSSGVTLTYSNPQLAVYGTVMTAYVKS